MTTDRELLDSIEAAYTKIEVQATCIAELEAMLELLREFTDLIERQDVNVSYSECYGKKTYGWGDRRNLIAMLYRKIKEIQNDEKRRSIPSSDQSNE